MRFKTFLAGAWVLLSMCGMLSTPAHAQSFLQTLFGFSNPAPRPSASVTSTRTNRSPRTLSNASRQPRRFADYTTTGPRSFRHSSRSGSYRTVCVRTCDGFYFPISAATSRAYFHKDAGTCRSRCGTATTLFYLPRRSTDMKWARDLEGRPYKDLKNAFKYRKSLVDGCTCRAMPWSSGERARHRRYQYIEAVQASYALAEARAKKRREDAAALAKKQRKQAIAIRKALLVARSNATGDNALAAQTTNLLLKNSPGFQYRWITVSRLFAAPRPDNRADPASSMNTASVVLLDHEDRQSSQGLETSRPPAFTIQGYGQNHRTKKARLSPSRRRPTTTARKKSRRKKKTTTAVFSGLFGQQSSKYSWPGD